MALKTKVKKSNEQKKIEQIIRIAKTTEKLVKKKKEVQSYEQVFMYIRMGLSPDHACRRANIPIRRYEEKYNQDTCFRMQADTAATYIADLAKEKVLKAIEKGDMQTVRWFLDRTDSRFTPTTAVSMSIRYDEPITISEAARVLKEQLQRVKESEKKIEQEQILLSNTATPLKENPVNTTSLEKVKQNNGI